MVHMTKEELKFHVGPHVSGGVGIEFRKPVSWLLLSKEQATEMAMSLLKHAGARIETAPRMRACDTVIEPRDATQAVTPHDS